jgi:hypothetical protein
MERWKLVTGLVVVSAGALLSQAGGCIVLGADFDKQPPIATGGAGGGAATPCETPSDCPGQEDECGHRTCEAGLCGIAATPADTPTQQQSAGDCMRSICDGSGHIIAVSDGADVPDDGNDCTDDSCAGGAPTTSPTAAGAPCGLGLQCDGQGTCTGCTDAAQCGAGGECFAWVCDANMNCQQELSPAGTPTSNQSPSDCLLAVCNESGQVDQVPDDGEIPDDGDVCTADSCSGGAPQHPFQPQGVQCGECLACDGAGVCSACPADWLCASSVCVPPEVLPDGSACQVDVQCQNAHCVASVCCDTACDGVCQSCVGAFTGGVDGTCGVVADGTDPEDECAAPAADVCAAGVCSCQNGVQDGDEMALDCGGSYCDPCGTWVCGEALGCVGQTPGECCVDPGCSNCADQSATCAATAGALCQLGTAALDLTDGTFVANDCGGVAGTSACLYAHCECQ